MRGELKQDRNMQTAVLDPSRKSDHQTKVAWDWKLQQISAGLSVPQTSLDSPCDGK